MKRLLALLTCLVFLVSIAFAQRTTHVKGSTRSNGTYVAPHERTAPNKTKTDNWSTKGNVNPNTGKRGTRNPY
jgi:hypothetical protein